MKLRTKIIIDKVAGLPIVYLLNALARLLGFLLRIDHSLNKPVKTIAVSKFVGMGSIVQSTPLLKTLRISYPSAKIIFITNAANAPLFQFIEEVDEVLRVSDKSMGSLLFSNLRLLLTLWKNRPDVYVDLEIYSNYSSIITTMSLAKNRMGFFKDDKMYRKGMYTHMIFFNIKSPISQSYLQFARLLGCKDVVTNVSLSTSEIDSEAMEKINKKLDSGLSENYILINPNASDLRLERRWPAENYIQVINRLTSKFPSFKFVLIGDRNDTEYVQKIASAISPEVKDSSGKLNLTELIILIKNATLLITNDTGPMHLAFGLKTKTVSLFGPCSPQQYGGMGSSIALYKNVYCSPCVHDFIIPPCKGDNQCMKKITVDEVMDAIQKALKNEYVKNNFPELDYTDADAAPLGVVIR